MRMRLQAHAGTPPYTARVSAVRLTDALSDSGNRLDFSSWELEMKWLHYLVVMLAVSLVGCGDAIQSPDFTSALKSVSVTSDATSVALGETLQLAAIGHYSQPPGSPTETTARDITASASWTSDAPELATVDANGVVTALKVGTVGIVAKSGGVSSQTYLIDITAAALRGLQVRNAASTALQQVTLADGQSLPLFAWGVYSDGSTRLLDSTVHLAHWASNNTLVAIIDAASGTSVTLSSVAQGSASLAVSLTDPISGNPIVGRDGATPIALTLPVIVGVAQVASLSHIRWSDDATPLDTVPTDDLRIGVGATKKAVAIATFTDGTSNIVADSLLNWSTLPASSPLASVSTDGAVSGIDKGTLDLVAALKTAPVGGGTASVSRQLAVNDPSCLNPARDDRYYANGWITPVLCLVCMTTGATNVINADDSDYADLRNIVGLLGGETGLNVGLKPNTDGSVDTLNTGPAPKPVSFLIAVDPGTFPVLSLSLFNVLYISLHLDTDIDAAPLNNDNLSGDNFYGTLGFDSLTNRVASSSGTLNALHLTLLGLELVPGLETVEVSYVPPANVEYNRLRLGNNAGVAEVSLTESIHVTNACMSE